MKQKTLFISDLDGTLLQPNERLSPFTRETLEDLINQGMTFSYATARSYATSRICTAGLNAPIPLITHNGTFIVDNQTGRILHKNVFEKDLALKIYTLLSSYGISPIVYSLSRDKERFSFNWTDISDETRAFLLTRQGDARERKLFSNDDILDGEVYYFACIEKAEKLALPYNELLTEYHAEIYAVCQKDIYSGHQWLEIMPKSAGKANAAKTLKEMVGADRLIVFGDGKNDIPLFEAGDEGYAVANADPQLKKIASAIIGSNTENGVAKWLIEYWNTD